MSNSTSDEVLWDAEPADEYARRNGLTLDSSINAPLLFASLFHSHNHAESLQDGADLRLLCLPSLPFSDRPSIQKATIDFLHHVQLREDVHSTHEMVFSAMSKKPRTQKLELPLLQSDCELDCLRLQRDIRLRKIADVRADRPPAEPLNVSHDESLCFPESAHHYHKELSKALYTDHIAISRDAIYCLERTLHDMGEDADNISKTMFGNLSQKRSQTRKITPPLSPISVPEQCFIPDPEASQIPLSSDPSTLLNIDLDAAHAALLQGQSSPHFPSTPCLSPLEDIPVIFLESSRVKPLKIEKPLLPSEIAETLPNGMLSFKQAIEDLQAGQVEVDLDSDRRETLDEMLSDGLMRLLQEAATASRDNIEQEQLEPADAIARLPVPVMDFSISGPEWAIHGSDPKSHFEMIMNDQSGLLIRRWLSDRAAQLHLQWSPFSSKLGRISLGESINDISIQPLLEKTGPNAVPDSFEYVWKQPGLAVLREEDIDDFLEPGYKNASQVAPSLSESTRHLDLHTLVRKRKMQVNAVKSTHTTPPPIDLLMISKTDFPQHSARDILINIDDPSASAKLLRNFVDFHASKRQRVAESSFFANVFVPASNHRRTGHQKIPGPDLSEPAEVMNISAAEHVVQLAPCPSLKAEGLPATIITALSLPRGIIAWIEKLLPHVNITERDFDRWSSVIWDRKAVSRSPVISTLAAEADVIVSPSTGILITSLIKATQRPLPGQKGKAAIRERLGNVSLRYERLIVLITENNRVNETARNMTDTECTDFSDFSGFVNGLNTETQTYYIGGGEETLSRWLAYFVVKHSYEARNIDELLIDSETTWELILRRAGMNAFAAQVVLSTLKEPRGVPDDALGRRGLAAYIKMTPQQRASMFAQLLGGERVLQRVGAVLDSRWE